MRTRPMDALGLVAHHVVVWDENTTGISLVVKSLHVNCFDIHAGRLGLYGALTLKKQEKSEA